MKYTQLVHQNYTNSISNQLTMPRDVEDWLEVELENRGFKPFSYKQHFLSLLQHEDDENDTAISSATCTSTTHSNNDINCFHPTSIHEKLECNSRTMEKESLQRFNDQALMSVATATANSANPQSGLQCVGSCAENVATVIDELRAKITEIECSRINAFFEDSININTTPSKNDFCCNLLSGESSSLFTNSAFLPSSRMSGIDGADQSSSSSSLERTRGLLRASPDRADNNRINNDFDYKCDNGTNDYDHLLNNVYDMDYLSLLINGERANNQGGSATRLYQRSAAAAAAAAATSLATSLLLAKFDASLENIWKRSNNHFDLQRNTVWSLGYADDNNKINRFYHGDLFNDFDRHEEKQYEGETTYKSEETDEKSGLVKDTDDDDDDDDDDEEVVDEDEDLLTSTRTHFRPIRIEDETSISTHSGAAPNVTVYEDGATFNVSTELNTVPYERSASGMLCLDASRYLEFRADFIATNSSSTTNGNINTVTSCSSLTDNEEFIPKFRVRHSNEKFCQTDDLDLESTVPSPNASIGGSDEVDQIDDDVDEEFYFPGDGALAEDIVSEKWTEDMELRSIIENNQPIDEASSWNGEAIVDEILDDNDDNCCDIYDRFDDNHQLEIINPILLQQWKNSARLTWSPAETISRSVLREIWHDDSHDRIYFDNDDDGMKIVRRTLRDLWTPSSSNATSPISVDDIWSSQLTLKHYRRNDEEFYDNEEILSDLGLTNGGHLTMMTLDEAALVSTDDTLLGHNYQNDSDDENEMDPMALLPQDILYPSSPITPTTHIFEEPEEVILPNLCYSTASSSAKDLWSMWSFLNIELRFNEQRSTTTSSLHYNADDTVQFERKRRNSSSQRVCSMYLEGGCCRRPHCRFQHTDAAVPCPFYADASCHKGDACPLAHHNLLTPPVIPALPAVFSPYPYYHRHETQIHSRAFTL